MKLFAKKGKVVNFFRQKMHVNVSQGSKYASVYMPRYCNENIELMSKVLSMSKLFVFRIYFIRVNLDGG